MRRRLVRLSRADLTWDIKENPTGRNSYRIILACTVWTVCSVHPNPIGKHHVRLVAYSSHIRCLDKAHCTTTNPSEENLVKSHNPIIIMSPDNPGSVVPVSIHVPAHPHLHVPAPALAADTNN